MKQSAVEWLFSKLWDKPKDKFIWNSTLVQAKQMEADREYETKAFWFGRGILAGKENKIKELQPQKETTM